MHLHQPIVWDASQALNNDLEEELPEDDEEDNDFTLDELDGLLASMDSDAEEDLPVPEPELNNTEPQSQAAAKHGRRRLGGHDQPRWAAQQLYPAGFASGMRSGTPHNSSHLPMHMGNHKCWLRSGVR